MRDFFINAFEKIIAVVLVLMVVGVVIGAIGAAMAPQGGGVFAALAILVFGGLYVIVMGGIMYLGLGIYHNTLATAKATQALADRQP